jgi:hypothetical protein
LLVLLLCCNVVSVEEFSRFLEFGGFVGSSIGGEQRSQVHKFRRGEFLYFDLVKVVFFYISPSLLFFGNVWVLENGWELEL